MYVTPNLFFPAVLVDVGVRVGRSRLREAVITENAVAQGIVVGERLTSFVQGLIATPARFGMVTLNGLRNAYCKWRRVGYFLNLRTAFCWHHFHHNELGILSPDLHDHLYRIALQGFVFLVLNNGLIV